jgi:hypothetical protein
VVSDALGHDIRAYDAGRLTLLEHELDWLFSGHGGARREQATFLPAIAAALGAHA